MIDFFHGYTYSGHPIACAAAIGTLDTYQEEGLLTRAMELAPYWEERVHALKGLPHVIDIRNIGLIGAIEFEPNPAQPASAPTTASSNASRTACSCARRATSSRCLRRSSSRRRRSTSVRHVHQGLEESRLVPGRHPRGRERGERTRDPGFWPKVQYCGTAGPCADLAPSTRLAPRSAEDDERNPSRDPAMHTIENAINGRKRRRLRRAWRPSSIRRPASRPRRCRSQRSMK